MESVTKLESLSEEYLLPCRSLRKESFIRNVVDVLDRNHLFLKLVEVVDERSMSCRTEKE